MLKKTTTAGLCIGMIYSCNLIHRSNDDENNESLKYEFEENGCNTGQHTFSNNGDYCAGLLDDSLNKGCARSLREKAFEAAGCGTLPKTSTPLGSFDPSPSRLPSVVPSPSNSVKRTIEFLDITAKTKNGFVVQKNADKTTTVSAEFTEWRVTNGVDFKEAVDCTWMQIIIPTLDFCSGGSSRSCRLEADGSGMLTLTYENVSEYCSLSEFKSADVLLQVPSFVTEGKTEVKATTIKIPH